MTIKEYCEKSITECDKFREKWIKIDYTTSKVYEGMAEAYNDILERINSGEFK